MENPPVTDIVYQRHECARLFCLDGGSGWDDAPSLHSEPRAGTGE